MNEYRQIYGCGNNQEFQIGTGSTASRYSIPILVAGVPTSDTLLSAGFSTSLYVTITGLPFVAPSTRIIESKTPTQITSLDGIFKRVYAGGFHSFFQSENGEFYSSGQNDQSERVRLFFLKFRKVFLDYLLLCFSNINQLKYPLMM